MTSRFAGLLGLAALALTSTACTYKTQTQLREGVDYSDYAYYDRPFAASPSNDAPRADATQQPPLRATASRDASEGASDSEDVADAPAKGRGHVAGNTGFGFQAGGSQATTTATSTEYEEVEATPGTACYEAAVKAGIKSGVCTLVSERKYVLVGERAR